MFPGPRSLKTGKHINVCILTLVFSHYFSCTRTKKCFWNRFILEKNWEEQKTEVQTGQASRLF